MEPRERLRVAFESLGDHPRRVIASASGVFWGAAALVMLMAWGAGFRESMYQQLSGFGSGLIEIHPTVTSSGFPGFRPGVPVRVAREDLDAARIAHPDKIEAVIPEHYTREPNVVEHRGRFRHLLVNGVPHQYFHYRRFAIARGRAFDAGDQARHRAVAVLGHKAAVELFGPTASPIGQKVRIDGKSFQVIGVAREKGTQYENTNRPDNEVVLVPVTTAESRLGYDAYELEKLSIYPRKGVEWREALNAALQTLGPRAGFHPDDLESLVYYRRGQALDLVDVFYAGFLIFIGSAGVVTLLVGGVGIANYHLATLAERSLEIAVAKAIGARSRTLVIQATLESLMVAGGAALAGILLGVGSCVGLARLIPAGVFPAPILSGTVIATVALALVGVSAIASVGPALRVRRMDVALALRSAL
jgi:putative ABC transport system permease protein